VNIEHSQLLAQSFNAAGISAAHLDGKTPKERRRSTLQAYAQGEYQVICNVALFGEGFDLASNAGVEDVTVDCVISARPTMSLGMWMQQCGRCLRPKEDGSAAIILDHAGNALRHGLPDEIREWTLEDQERSKKEGGASVRECPECFCCCPSHLRECPNCGYVWVVKHQQRDLSEEEGQLSELDKEWRRARAKSKTLQLSDAEKKRRARELMSCRSYRELYDLARARGYRKPAWWAEQRWAERAPQIAEEDACVVDGSWQKTEDNFTALARRRGMVRPIGWARAVMKNRERRGIL
jgi:superfamily II DNA or RNA helicase